ncbi:hypothetical protein HA466_0303330 [Hirschfeldia incana]|nr:hypothetical protein HA466_0303330 [Hirschfeldia incana]
MVPKVYEAINKNRRKASSLFMLPQSPPQIPSLPFSHTLISFQALMSPFSHTLIALRAPMSKLSDVLTPSQLPMLLNEPLSFAHRPSQMTLALLTCSCPPMSLSPTPHLPSEKTVVAQWPFINSSSPNGLFLLPNEALIMLSFKSCYKCILFHRNESFR